MANKPTVLLIEDERLLLKATAMVLKHAGFEILSANNGQTGLELASSEIPDAILLDIMMPGMDGWEVLKILKNQDLTSGIPVIIFTAKEHLDGYRMSLKAGAADYLTKPFDNDDLIKRLRCVITQENCEASRRELEENHAD